MLGVQYRARMFGSGQERSTGGGSWGDLSAHVNDGAVCDIGDSFAKDFMGQRRCIAFTKEKEFNDIGDWVALFPLEVDVWCAARGFFNVNEKSRDGVGDDGAAGAEDAVVGYFFALNGKMLIELGGVGSFHFEEDDFRMGWKAMDGANQFVDSVEVLRSSRFRASRDNADYLITRIFQNVVRLIGEVNAGNAEFCGTCSAGDE